MSFSKFEFYDRDRIMTNIICIANQKGGVGKTTTAINLSAALADAGKQTLLVDCDPQANATSGVGIDKSGIKTLLYHGLIGSRDTGDLIVDSQVDGLKVIPANEDLTGFEVEMMSHPERGVALKKLLAQLEDSFEYIILDCPPSLGLLTINALAAAHSLLIPLQCEYFALEGLSQLSKTIKRVAKGLNPKLRIAGILLTMYDLRTNLSRQVAEDARNKFKDLVFKTVVPRNVRLGEAPSFGKPIFLYDGSSIGAKSYTALAREILAGNP